MRRREAALAPPTSAADKGDGLWFGVGELLKAANDDAMSDDRAPLDDLDLVVGLRGFEPPTS